MRTIDLKHIGHSFTIDTPHRVWLEAAYKTNAIVQFKGTVEHMTKESVLFTALYIRLDYMDGGMNDVGYEEHVWIGRNHTDEVGDAKPFHDAGVVVGDAVSFEGNVFLYRRHDKTFDYAIENCRNIEKIDPYSLPSDDDMMKQELGHLVCEMCLFSSQCYGEPCIAPDGYQEQMINSMINILNETSDT